MSPRIRGPDGSRATGSGVGAPAQGLRGACSCPAAGCPGGQRAPGGEPSVPAGGRPRWGRCPAGCPPVGRGCQVSGSRTLGSLRSPIRGHFTEAPKATHSPRNPQRHQSSGGDACSFGGLWGSVCTPPPGMDAGKHAACGDDPDGRLGPWASHPGNLSARGLPWPPVALSSDGGGDPWDCGSL